MTYVITQACINTKDKSCVDVCPVDCIYEGPDMLYIHPDECIDCGACEPECPVTAIFPDMDVPTNQTQYLKINADAFKSATPPHPPTRGDANRPVFPVLRHYQKNLRHAEHRSAP